VLGHLAFGYRLRRGAPDVALMLSPGQLAKGALYMQLSGAQKRIAHRYPHLGNPASAFLLTDAVLEEEGLHDIEQNLNLLLPLNIDIAPWQGQPYHFPPVPAQPRPAGVKIIGFHAGSATDFTWKRWPLQRFAEVGRALVTEHQAKILIFSGAAEREQSRQLQQLIGEAHASLITTNLLAAAGLIQHCDLFLSNDSGLMHIAAALGVATIGIFGPTDERTTGPRGVRSSVVRAPGTSPVYHTERHHSLGQETHETLLKVTPALVLDKIADILSQ